MNPKNLGADYIRIRDVARAVASGRDQDHTLALLLGGAMRETNASCGYVMLVGGAKPYEVRLYQPEGHPAAPYDGRSPVSKTLVDRCLELGTLISHFPFDRVVTRTETLELESASMKITPKLASALAAPFVDGNGTSLGAMVLYKFHDCFGFADRSIVEPHAAGATVALATGPTPVKLPSPGASEHVPGLVGQAYLPVRHRLKSFAMYDEPLLITGAPGTGKEATARAFHGWTERAGPYIAVNMASVTDTLADSELFGHAAGAYTDAPKAKAGLFEDANGGTLFLDELGEMSLKVQAKLLRAIENRKIRRVAESKERNVDVRIVAATNRDLPQMVADGEFRADLYERFRVATVHLPSLKDHMEDLPVLVSSLLERISGRLKWKRKSKIDSEAMKRLQAHDWPGNVRELFHTLLCAAMLATEGHALGPFLDIAKKTVVRVRENSPEAKQYEYERATYLLMHHNNVKVVAGMMGMDDPSTLYRWIRKGYVKWSRSESDEGEQDSPSAASVAG